MNQHIKCLNLHLISDSTCETVLSVARKAVTQFSNIQVNEYVWSLVNTTAQIDNIIAKLTHTGHAFVMYTIIDNKVCTYLKNKCHRIKVPCVAILARIINELSVYLDITKNTNTTPKALNKDYFARIEAINYAIAHDDGQSIADIDEADIIIVGASRTSKSPTSMYLAYRGYKVANVPYIEGTDLPTVVLEAKNQLVIGLTIDPIRLIEIRKNRLVGLENNTNTLYTNYHDVTQEIHNIEKLLRQKNWPIINVDHRSIEEITAKIILYHNKFIKDTQNN